MPEIIQDLTLLLLVSLPINVFFHRIRLPSIMGFLIAGILIGPHCLGWIGNPSSVENLAEIGIILLLFIIGLEFSISHLLKNMASIISAGVLQMGLTIAAWYFLHKNYFGGPDPVIIALAMMVALSSTAIVFKMVTDRAELDTLHGRTTIGILLFQDLCVVPLMLMIPLLAHSGQTSGTDFALAFAKALAAVAGIFFLSRLLVPRFLSAVARMGSKEHLTLLVILIILGSGWVSHQLGLSLAMGAFIAGLIISESEYSHQIILDILPLRDYFSSIFFISIGMLLNIGNFLDHFSLILGITLILVVMKVVSGFLASVAVGNSARISFIVGVRLAQVGEFSLILAGLVVFLTAAYWLGALLLVPADDAVDLRRDADDDGGTAASPAAAGRSRPFPSRWRPVAAHGQGSFPSCPSSRRPTPSTRQSRRRSSCISTSRFRALR